VAQKVESGAAVHGSFDDLQPVDLTSLLTQSIGEGFYKQLCAEEG
jgi:hypothetical protein